MCAAQETTNNNMKEGLYMYKYVIKEIHAINRYMREHIDSCQKEFKISAVYPEHSTAHLNNIANITIESDSITPKNEKNGREENSQKYQNIPFDKNEAKNSIIASETILPNASETIEPNKSNKTEQIASKQK